MTYTWPEESVDVGGGGDGTAAAERVESAVREPAAAATGMSPATKLLIFAAPVLTC